MNVYIDNKTVRLDPKNSAVGGEARVFFLPNLAVKIFHDIDPDWPDPKKMEWQRFLKLKIEKLKAFPANLPPSVITPQKLAFDSNGKIIGYSMELIQNASDVYSFMQKNVRILLDNEEIGAVLRDALAVLKKIHQAQTVVGDLNSGNILYKAKRAYYIDADSMQFANLPCVVATEDFLDPALYGKDFFRKPVFSKETDYYAYAVIVFLSLLRVHPYGGIHPNYPTKMRRAQLRVSVFDPKVRYPAKGIHYKVLPDAMLQYFEEVFGKGKRDAFPENLFQNLRWTTCPACGVSHARAICPICASAPAATKEAVTVRGRCFASHIFQTKGDILASAMQNGKLRYLYLEENEVKRETGESVFPQRPTTDMKFEILGDKTAIGKGNQIAIVENEKVVSQMTTEKLGHAPMFSCNANDIFTASGDYLVRNNADIWGSILQNQTWFKVGPAFGVGFYRVGQRTVYFVFDAEKAGIDDSVKLPPIRGKLLDADCVFNNDSALLSLSQIENGKVINVMNIISSDGKVKASAEAEADNSRILKSVGGKALAAGNVLCATDQGLVLAVSENNQIAEAKHFPDTDPFVSEDSEIYQAGNGVYVVSAKTIKLLRLI